MGKQQWLRFRKQLLYDESMDDPLQIAVNKVGGQAALASHIGVKQQHVWNWLNRRGFVPPEHCAAIESATEREVTRQHLRPHDWHRIWPELVTLERPAPEAAAAESAAAVGG